MLARQCVTAHLPRGRRENAVLTVEKFALAHDHQLLTRVSLYTPFSKIDEWLSVCCNLGKA